MFRNTTIEKGSCNSGDFDQLALCAGQMYFIALVLADDEEFAARWTRDSFDRLLSGNRPFDDWRKRWARRLTIMACIKRKRSELQLEVFTSEFWEQSLANLSEYVVKSYREISADSIQRGVRSLPLLPRFVFVSRSLEHNTAVDTALLLEIDRKTCEAAGAYALAALTRTIHSSELHGWIDEHCCA